MACWWFAFCFINSTEIAMRFGSVFAAKVGSQIWPAPDDVRRSPLLRQDPLPAMLVCTQGKTGFWGKSPSLPCSYICKVRESIQVN